MILDSRGGDTAADRASGEIDAGSLGTGTISILLHKLHNRLR